MKRILSHSTIFCVLLWLICKQAEATGFVHLPQEGLGGSAYLACNQTGDFGIATSEQPTESENNRCAVFLRNTFRAPLPDYDFVAESTRIIHMPAPHAGIDDNVGHVVDLVWRNAAQSSCIYATFVHVNDIPLANGQYWEVNDVVRGGFAGQALDVAYLFAYHPKGVRSTESVFRIGRSFTSVKHAHGDTDLPSTIGASPANTPIASNQAAAVDDNWVDFTTDLNWHDPDGSSFPDGSYMYIKAACTAEPPIEMNGAIRLRTTGQSGQAPIEISVAGFVASGASLDAR